ncbi:hypothetical protein B9T31_12560 [Acinetobacter sp. ANC 4558]|nr:hypothetical protein B9T31_12560 [Acinetobacter sp. ANC 4558]
MIGHQREVLTQLGIDVWIPRNVACQKIDQTMLWRDQEIFEIATQLESIPVPQVKQSLTSQKVIVENKQKQKDLVVKESLSEVIQEEQPRLEIANFSLQAIVLSNIVVILNSTDINEPQQHLWANIQRAVQAEFFELNWPFAMENMNDGQGAAYYVQGFIDSISSEKKVICLGEILHLKNSTIMHLASLQEMLETPILKRQLWNVIQSSQMSV